ncbi:NAD(P)/FAD-dependent oxidoreductase [Nocardioides KLBMP 9356]|uniref:NAD(P)/FAD-dependent oxidoreductase n=1 Tax=Nocardioides potassii TaxID=2911371 RepID=A0ABS9H5Y6_9ACTN|nr:NAD(P)/FAD-dependent oxidoreductase [Nocardioides potassii]MCF6376665.1 NAD(P)/FAD-dependent oxidoreductase [Nocardioides potassii]
MTVTEHLYDVVVIGAGPAGENVADRVVAGGLTAVVVEQQLVGGECSYWACMPTKALLSATTSHPARTLGASDAAEQVAAALARRDRFASHWHDDDQVAWLDSAGIALLRGRARLAGRLAVDVLPADSDEPVARVTARHAVVLATGTSALVPPVPGLREVGAWTSRDAAAAQEVPASLAIVGGGVVATEMATAYADLGSAVTVLARDGVLPNLEPFASAMVVRSLEDAGVDVRLGAEVVGARRDERGVELDVGGAGTVRADEVLVAVGRRPNTHGLGLGSIGLDDGSWISVDETLRVLDRDGTLLDGGWLYAVGDVNGRALVTHQGKYQARAAGDAIVARAAGLAADDEPWGWHAATADHAAVPQVVFSHPEVAAVGVTLDQARSRGIEAVAVDFDLSATAGAALRPDGFRGQARLVVDRPRDVVVGATFAGDGVDELLHAATIAVVGEVPVKRLWHAVPAFPTVSEAWLRLLEAYGRPDSRHDLSGRPARVPA